MHIGVTYDLRSDYLAMGYGEEETAEFDSEVTIDAICHSLVSLGWQVTPNRRANLLFLKPVSQRPPW